MKSLKPLLLAALIALAAQATHAQAPEQYNSGPSTATSPTSQGGLCSLGAFPTLAILSSSYSPSQTPLGCLAYTGDHSIGPQLIPSDQSGAQAS
jgi:hypothetical protein